MNQQDLRARADAFVAENREAVLKDLAALVAIPSVQGPAAPGQPFGPQVARALDRCV